MSHRTKRGSLLVPRRNLSDKKKRKINRATPVAQERNPTAPTRRHADTPVQQREDCREPIGSRRVRRRGASQDFWGKVRNYHASDCCVKKVRVRKRSLSQIPRSCAYRRALDIPDATELLVRKLSAPGPALCESGLRRYAGD